MAITINHDIKLPSTCGMLIGPDGVAIGEIENELQLNDIQIQIAKEKVVGYSILWKENVIAIAADGSPDCWPDGWCDQSQYAFSELRKVRKGIEVHEEDTKWRFND